MRLIIYNNSFKNNLNNIVSLKRRPKRNFELSHRNGNHIHFGAGKLSMGLIIPAIHRKNVPLVILQRKSCDWKYLSEGDRIKLMINGSDALFGDDIVITETVENINYNEKSMLLSNNKEHWLDCALRASTMSCSLGPSCADVLVPLLQNLPMRSDEERRPILYACENDTIAVKDLMTGLAGRVDVILCTVDRICTERTIKEDSIEVITEEDPGTIVVYGKDVPLSWSNMITTNDPNVAEYMAFEKKIFVNGIHTLAALISLSMDKKHCMEKNINSDFFETIDMDFWIVATVIYIISEWGLYIPCKAYGCSNEELVNILLQKGNCIRNRLHETSQSDTPSRILRRGVSYCYVHRVMPVLIGYHNSIMTSTIRQVYISSGTTPSDIEGALEFIKKHCTQSCLNSLRKS
ncbi:putative mannitol 1-phosphate dehydrogenase [Tetraselmis virus 1]|uniref:Putative mannitol 1-phosphate dehydrogenase n=1 Tax=Tetraselmis virus 1 TaxID=2060617 RepID=A0A2P0VNE0_9VIRU|nr:putative mannitol 1-phosphate dehydrogenase [Tetraselmis virus 1]AUF82412.1 putative mannitol 1-phosphate dehydrogenase [Tetraselmis virus 1]